jgi:hypothetical protein
MGDPQMYDMPETPEEFNRLMRRVADDLGWNDMNMRRDRPYAGQPHTDTGLRGKTEVKGITFRDLRDCFIRAVCLCGGDQFPELRDEAYKGENAALCENDLYKLDLNQLDIIAVFQTLSCEVEKIMGIYPNVPELKGE